MSCKSENARGLMIPQRALGHCQAQWNQYEITESGRFRITIYISRYSMNGCHETRFEKYSPEDVYTKTLFQKYACNISLIRRNFYIHRTKCDAQTFRN